MPVQKKCVTCGKQFSVPKCRSETAKTCSQTCRGVQIAAAYESKRAKVKCAACGRLFSCPPAHADRRIFCSDKCASTSRTTLNRSRAENHYAWNGGKSAHNEGYLYLSVPNHPGGSRNGNYVLEHRVVMEEMMRQSAPDHPFLYNVDGARYLRPEIQVHHINEVKRDNRPVNLLACTAAAHHDIHGGLAPMQGEVWPDVEGLRPLAPRWITVHCGACDSEIRKRAVDVQRGSGNFFCNRLCYTNRPKRTRNAFEIVKKD